MREGPLLTPDAFNALAELMRMLDGPAREAARLMLCEGLSAIEAGARAGCSRQSATNAAARCRAGLELAKRAAAGG